MATIDIYDKGQTDALLAGKADTADLPSAAELVPDYSGASADDVLTIENGAPVWKAAGGSEDILEFASWSDFINWADASSKTGDVVEYLYVTFRNGSNPDYASFAIISNWRLKTYSVSGNRNTGPCVGVCRQSTSGVITAALCSLGPTGYNNLIMYGSSVKEITNADLLTFEARVRIT